MTDSAVRLLIRPVLSQEFLQILRSPKLALRFALAAVAIAFAVTALAQSNAKDDDDDDEQLPLASAPAIPKKDPASLPLQELTEPVLLGLLVAEIAAQRDSTGYAAQTYVDLAKKTRDPRIARRSAEIANYARLPNLALESARQGSR